jgi:hypothetical protein
MNLRLFSIALLVSALPQMAMAESAGVSFNAGDFISAQRIEKVGDTPIRVKLSKSGKAKLKKLNETSVNKKIHAEIAGVSTDFELREPIKGDGLEMGPYSDEQAKRVLAEINKK